MSEWSREERIQLGKSVCACSFHVNLKVLFYLKFLLRFGLGRQADHELAVAEGGGCCGLANLRTLCTPCHRKETAALRLRLRRKVATAAARGTADLRAWFKGPAPISTPEAAPRDPWQVQNQKPPETQLLVSGLKQSAGHGIEFSDD